MIILDTNVLSQLLLPLLWPAHDNLAMVFILSFNCQTV